jgi:hypothetical protein
MEENWSPAARLIVGAAGSAQAVYGAGRRDALGFALGAVGLGLLARGVTSTEFKRLIETGAQPRDAAKNEPPLTREATAC